MTKTDKTGDDRPNGRRGLIVIMLLFVGITMAARRLSAEDVFSVENVKGFADYLFKQGDYESAAHEYHRLHYLTPYNDAIRYQLAICYEQSTIHSVELADSLYHELIERSTDPNLVAKARGRLAMLEFDQKNYPASIDMIQQIDWNSDLLDWDQRRKYSNLRDTLLIGSMLMMKEFDRALKEIEGIPRSSDRQQYPTGWGLYRKGVQLPRKKPWLSSLLSAVVPGLGKIYTGHFGDGIVSMISVSSMGWLSYRGFQREGTGSVSGWFFSSVGSIFYAGNIYGSNIAAKIYNEQHQNQYNEEVRTWVEEMASRIEW